MLRVPQHDTQFLTLNLQPLTSPHRYTLEPYHGMKSRFSCPNCHHKQTFTRYIDTETNTHLADHVGKCNRLDNCGYHHTPRAYFANETAAKAISYEPARANHFDTLPYRYVTDTTKAYDSNHFITFLTKWLDVSTALRLAEKYKIGTSKHWPGATIFWQIDVSGNVRTGKIMLYNPADGHRVKQPYNHIAWAHNLSQKSKVESQKPDFSLQQCFFGEHLLNTHPFKTVAIAEAEKTAIVCSFIYPEYLWLAAGSLEGLNVGKCSVLKNRRVILYPDLNAYHHWKLKKQELRGRLHNLNMSIDNSLERTATPEERQRGIDLADRWIEQMMK